MGDAALRRPGREEQQVEGLPHRDAAGDMDERALPHEGRAERGERVALDAGVAAEVGGQQVAVTLQRLPKAPELHARWQSPGDRPFRPEYAIHEHQPRTRGSTQHVLNRFGRGLGSGRGGQRERRLGQRGYVREAPLFLPRLLKPGGRRADAIAREPPEFGDVAIPRVHLMRHATAASGLIQSYPFSSNSSASSLPPERAMRPSTSTWTKSGTMWFS